MEQQIKLHGVRRFWFVDSLVNGNLKNFQRLVDLILEKELNIKWNSYARCDGRMTKEFIEKIYMSGCTCLSYGVESGSQKVLLDMRKKVDIWEIENNLKHGAEVGLFNHINWMIGFPTEEPIDFLHSLQLLANARTHIGAISPGFGAGPAMFSHMATDWKEYNMIGDKWLGDNNFLGTWYTEGYQNTILNRFIRIKMVHVWLDILEKNANSTIINSQRYPNIEDFYKFTTNATCKDYQKPDDFVSLQLNTSNNFSNIITNEYLSIIYAIYIYFGEFTLTLSFDKTKDKETFGDWLVHDYTADILVKINSDGNYVIHIKHEFKHTHEVEILIKDQSFNESFTERGNINDWVSSVSQVKETVHEQYRNKKKVISITSLQSS